MIARRGARMVVFTLGTILLAGCVSAPMPGLTPTPTETSVPTAMAPAGTEVPTETPGPTPVPINIPRLYDGPLPEGAVARLGQGWPSEVVTSPDGQMVAVGMSTGVQVYDVDTLALLWAAPTTERVSAVAWSRDSAKVAAGLYDGRIVAWKGKSGVGLLDLASDDGLIDALDWTPDGAYLIASTARGFTKMWDGETGEPLYRRTYVEKSYVSAYDEPISQVDASLSPDGRTYATHYDFGGSGGPRTPGRVIVLWDVASGTITHVIEIPETIGVSVVRWSPDGELLASGSTHGGPMGLWKASTGELVGSFESGSWHFDWSPDGARILLSAFGKLSVLDVATRSTAIDLDSQATMSEFLGWSGDSAQVTLFEDDARVVTYDALTGRVINPAAVPPTSGPQRYFVIVGDEYYYNPALLISYSPFRGWWEGECNNAFLMTEDKDLADSACPSVRAESPDGSLLAIAYNTETERFFREERAGAISIHDPKTGARLKILRGHSSFVTVLAFSPDGSLLASGSDDGTVILWDMTSLSHP